MPVQILKRRFTVEEYHRMGEARIFSEEDRVELIEGEVIEMTPIGSRHAAHVDRLLDVLTSALSRRAIIRVQSPVQLGPTSELQPDLSVLRRRPDFYANAHPGPDDILLVVEISDTSVDFDRMVKIPLYAPAGVRESWVVDLGGQCVEVYRTPMRDGYRDLQRAARGQRYSMEAFPDLIFSVDDVLI